jgi:hypothetical protein
MLPSLSLDPQEVVDVHINWQDRYSVDWCALAAQKSRYRFAVSGQAGGQQQA